MRTVGIDLAADAKRTAIAWVTWEPGRAVVTNLLMGADDATILDAIVRSDKAGIDCPLGWPVDFVTFLIAHQAGKQLAADGATGRDLRRSLTTRLTDRVVRAETHLVPLSVAADRIGHVAMRCSELLDQLARSGQPVDRTGAGTVVEVYPAASLARWGLPHRGYKGQNGAPVLDQLVNGVRSKAEWLVLGEFEDQCRKSDDAADAVIAALTARAAAVGLIKAPDMAQIILAKTEGWIAIPTPASLSYLL
jgi:predicted nuclease with RNAse H fold